MDADNVVIPDERKQVFGIWDLRLSPMSLGGLLILVAELKMQCKIRGIESADVCIVGDTARLISSKHTQPNGGPVILLDSEACKGSPLLSMLLDMEGIGACYLYSTVAALKDSVQAGSCQHVAWPPLSDYGVSSHRYASTIYAQRFYREQGFVSHLSCKAKHIRYAAHFIERNVAPSVPVVVHLKNNPRERGCSNADFDAWFTFFQECSSRYSDVKFILVGNEAIDQRILDLPNVLAARSFESNLSRDLTLIQTAFAFMGMASGPCTMAVFGKVPYVILKNPNHDVEQMALELGEADRLPFAMGFQKILRVFETGDCLMSEFEHLYTSSSRQDWEKRLDSLRQAHTKSDEEG